MIELTEEMHSAFWDASVKQARKVANAKRPADLEGSICRAGLAAVLAIVERDQASVITPSGWHVWHLLEHQPVTAEEEKA